MADRQNSRSSSTGKPDAPIAGAAAQRPPMTSEEQLDRVKQAAGRFTPMRELRKQLPTARPEKASGERRSRATRSAEASGGAAAEAAADAPIVPLTMPQRELLIDQAILMLEDLYAHLPLKRALHAIDPIQRLRLLRLRHTALDERDFQSAMIDIFVGLRDLHTNYMLPSAYHRKYAFLPFRIEEYYENEQRKYLVSGVSPVNTDPKLTPGAEITHWNGVPIDLAVAHNASREAGSNEEARRARGSKR